MAICQITLELIGKKGTLLARLILISVTRQCVLQILLHYEALFVPLIFGLRCQADNLNFFINYLITENNMKF
jgi:hypothetical protein